MWSILTIPTTGDPSGAEKRRRSRTRSPILNPFSEKESAGNQRSQANVNSNGSSGTSDDVRPETRLVVEISLSDPGRRASTTAGDSGGPRGPADAAATPGQPNDPAATPSAGTGPGLVASWTIRFMLLRIICLSRRIKFLVPGERADFTREDFAKQSPPRRASCCRALPESRSFVTRIIANNYPPVSHFSVSRYGYDS